MPGVLQRLLETWRRGGLAGVLRKAAGRLFSRQTYVLLECRLNERGVSLPVPPGLSFSWVAVSDLGDFHQHEMASTDRSEQISAERLRRGDRCAAGIVDRRPATSLWLTSQLRELPNRRLPVGGKAVFVYKTFTVPEMRGRGLHRAVLQWALGSLREEGFERAWVDIETTNTPSLRAVKAVGFAEVGRFTTYTLGGVPFTTIPKHLARLVAGRA